MVIKYFLYYNKINKRLKYISLRIINFDKNLK